MTNTAIDLPAPVLPNPLPAGQQDLMDLFYGYWREACDKIQTYNEKQSKAENYINKPVQDEIIAIFPSKVNIAVILGNFNYQVNNGGFMQWDDNGYSRHISKLKNLFLGAKSIKIENADAVLVLLEEFEEIKNGSKEPVRFTNYGPDGDEEFEEEVHGDFSGLDTIYYAIPNVEEMMQEILDKYEQVLLGTLWEKNFQPLLGG